MIIVNTIPNPNGRDHQPSPVKNAKMPKMSREQMIKMATIPYVFMEIPLKKA